MKTRKLGNIDLVVSSNGLDLMGMSGSYGQTDDEQTMKTI
jgi:aryl-alcohol dehydrogenase-like predicted oxidoreductase